MSIRSRAYNFTSMHSEWRTPDDLFKALDNEFHFTLDVAATRENRKCERFICELDPVMPWPRGEVIWCNPPYGRCLGEWVKRAYEASIYRGSTVVMLLPVRTSVPWFHDYCLKGEIRFIRKRVRFGGLNVNAPFDSMVVVFRPGNMEGVQ